MFQINYFKTLGSSAAVIPSIANSCGVLPSASCAPICNCSNSSNTDSRLIYYLYISLHVFIVDYFITIKCR